MARKRVKIDLLSERSQIFGESAWSVVASESVPLELHGTHKAIRERIRVACPSTPGVYGMLSQEGHVDYVGMSCSLPKRLQSYFSATRRRRKETRIRQRAHGLLWQSVPHEILARLRERELIRRFRPALNVQGQPVQMQIGYIIAVDQNAPSLQLVEEIPKRHVGIWGPLPLNSFTKNAVEQLNLFFGLRDCSKQTLMQFQGEQSDPQAVPPACLRADLQTCLSPCLGGCTRTEYDTALRAVHRFLNGSTGRHLSTLEKHMRQASADQHFEKAAKLRDRIVAFEYVDNHLRRFHDWSSRASFVYRMDSAIDQSELWMIVVRGVILDVVSQPQTPEMKRLIAQRIESAVKQTLGRAKNRNLSQPGDFEAARILFRWFRKHPEEKTRQLTLPQALTHCTRRTKHAS